MSDAIDRAARIEAEKRHAAGDLYSLEKSRLTTFVEGAEWAVAHLREAGLLPDVPPPNALDQQVARRWHEGSDHARDGEPFGGPLCNCMKVAGRLRPMLHQEWSDGWGYGWRSGQDAVNRAEGDGRAVGHE